jgi:hypothetical protein
MIIHLLIFYSSSFLYDQSSLLEVSDVNNMWWIIICMTSLVWWWWCYVQLHYHHHYFWYIMIIHLLIFHYRSFLYDQSSLLEGFDVNHHTKDQYMYNILGVMIILQHWKELPSSYFLKHNDHPSLDFPF